MSTPLVPALERVIAGVRRELPSYLDEVSLRTLAATVVSIEDAGVEGVIIETGTALGGSAITMAAAKSTARPMRVYDVFGMIPAPSEKDGPTSTAAMPRSPTGSPRASRARRTTAIGRTSEPR